MITPYSNIISVTTLPFLLDTYTGAAAAYSLRKLRSAYTGNAIRVRRSSDNTELNIGFVGGDLDTSALTTFCSGTDGFVTTWYDQSGNAYNFTQTTAANQPQIVSGGSVITENSKPIISIDDSNDFLRSNVIFGANNTIFSVFKNNDTQGVVYSGTNIGSDFIYAYRVNTGSIASGVTISSTYKNSVLQTLTNQTSVLNAINMGAQILWSSFLSSVNVARYSNFQIGQGAIGTTAINWSEVVIYPTDESANRVAIENNIKDFYGII